MIDLNTTPGILHYGIDLSACGLWQGAKGSPDSIRKKRAGKSSSKDRGCIQLIESANEALAIAEGKRKPAPLITSGQIDVAAIRKRLRLSQEKFAARFGLPVATVRDWEQKRRFPDRAASNFLRVIEHAPQTVVRALSKTE